VDNDHGGSLDFPKLTLVILRNSEAFDEGNPILNGDPNELTKIGVHDVLEAVDDAFQRRRFIVGTVGFE